MEGIYFLFLLYITASLAVDNEEEQIRVKRQYNQNLFTQYQSNRRDANWDPRSEEGWYMMYPYGKIAMDDELMGMNNRETQINLGFDFPYYGYRFNYTMPPFTFPNPRWPYERDHSFIAPFYAESTFQYVGSTRISNVWFRTVHRPKEENQQQYWQNYGQGQSANQPFYNPQSLNPQSPGQTGFQGYRQPSIGRKKRQIPSCSERVCNQPGRVIDPILLDNITRDVQEGINGANGWRAEFALVVTWERMAYGGAPKAVDVSQFEYVKQWQNTFQLIIASDEIRSYTIFNYARLNWTTSNEAGGLNGFGGKQAAMVGFNGGNGTGWTRLPYSGEGRVWKLAYFTNVLTPGRWVYRVDEEIVPGGCSNDSTGYMVVSPESGIQLGSIAVNVSGPCLRDNDFVKVVFEEWPVDCARLNRIRARCVMPIFHKTGLITLRMSRDGGQSYPYIGSFYVLPPQRAAPKVLLRDDVENPQNRWFMPNPDQLTLEWQALNLTSSGNARVDINIWGYYEDVDKSYFQKIDTLYAGQSNLGVYSFSPKTLSRNPKVSDAYKYYHFGFLQIALSNAENEGVLWSGLTPFSWYYLSQWQYEYGSNWATDLCIEWYEYDGRRRNFIMELEPCPCKFEQAAMDLGRFMPIFDCDRDGDTSCPFNKGAMHCVQSVQASFGGAGQQCCYDYQGFLMFTDDWEPTGDYTRFFNPGTPIRAHSFGSYPYKQPPRIPGLSNYQCDLMPYYMCCIYAQHCELYYWRRQSNGCQDYRPPGAAYIWGEPHIRTYDGTEFTFPGKGYFVLAMSEDPRHKLMVQVRLEQPPQTLWHTDVNATIVTGVAIKENDSDVVQVFSRYPEFRDWRYKTDVYVNGIRRFFDKPRWNYQQFRGVNIRNPQRNMNQSELIVMLASGAAVQIQESYGMLDVMVILPPSFNSTCDPNNPSTTMIGPYGTVRCYVTKGLLGSFTGNKEDDLMTLDGAVIRVAQDTYTRSTTQMIYEQFGLKWKVDGTDPRIGPVLFQDDQKPIYNPLLFVQRDYMPEFGPEYVSPNATLIFSIEEVKSTCMGNLQCQYDYLLTGRREVALTTLDYRNKFVGLQQKGSRLMVSCGSLLKSEGVVKTPPNQNYLDGDVVTFSCKPDYFLHGDAQRICRNGTWTEGWWVWCRSRNLEYALRWVTGLLTAAAFIILFAVVFCFCYRRRVKLNQGVVYRTKEPIRLQRPKAPDDPPKVYARSPSYGYDKEPARIGFYNGTGAENNKRDMIVLESSA